MHDLDVYINHEHVATLTIDAQVRIFAAQTGLNPNWSHLASRYYAKK